MAVQTFVAFDLGAESGRAVLGKLSGSRLTLDVKHRFANTPVQMNGALYWNTPSIWAELKTGPAQIRRRRRIQASPQARRNRR